MIRRLLNSLFTLMFTLGAMGAELRLPQTSMPMDMDCIPSADGTCPCGMPMPGPQPCSISIPSPVAVPTRTVATVVESATSADRALPEPKPWPVAWALQLWFEDAEGLASEPSPVDTGPPLLASERSAKLRIFRI